MPPLILALCITSEGAQAGRYYFKNELKVESRQHGPQSVRSGLSEVQLYQQIGCEASESGLSLVGGKPSFMEGNWLMRPLKAATVFYLLHLICHGVQLFAL